MSILLEALKELHEDVESSLPVRPLPEKDVYDFIMDIPKVTKGRPPYMFKLGYISELDKDIPSMYKGGRGSVDKATGVVYPKVRIFKCTEYSALYTGVDWKKTDDTKANDKILGAERHTGEKTGFGYEGQGDKVNRIGTYPNGDKALQAIISDGSKQKVKFFISLDDEDLHEATRQEIAKYLTPAKAAQLINPSPRVAAGLDAEGKELFDKPINRFKLSKIYMIGNLGHSIM